MDEPAWNLTQSESGNCLMFLKTLFPLEDQVLRDTQFAVLILFIIVSICGIFANTIVIYILNFKTKPTPLTILLNGLAVSDLLCCVHHSFATALPFLLVHFSTSTSYFISLRAVLNFKMISIPTHGIGKTPVKNLDLFDNEFNKELCIMLSSSLWHFISHYGNLHSKNYWNCLPLKSRHVVTKFRAQVASNSIWISSLLFMLFPFVQVYEWILTGKWDCRYSELHRLSYHLIAMGFAFFIVQICTIFMIYTVSKMFIWIRIIIVNQQFKLIPFNFNSYSDNVRTPSRRTKTIVLRKPH